MHGSHGGLIIQAGEFEIDAAAFELRRGADRVPVEPLVFSLILHLAENRQRLVTRDELVEVIWQGRAISDWAVSAAIKAARRALGDTTEPRRFIRTIHGKGFRFIAQREDAGETPVSLAVLPFRNLSDSGEQAYFADGVSEDLMIGLGRVPGLQVAPRFASFRFRDADDEPAGIGRALGVDHLLTGSIRRTGNEVRINTELVQAQSGAQLWSDRFSGGGGEILQLQDAVCTRIVESLRLHFAVPHGRRMTSDPAAYDLCLKGRWEYYLYTPANFARAAEYFARAIEIDPDYAEALAYLSYCKTSTYVFAWPGSDPTLDNALALAERAVALEQNSPVAYARLGWVLGFLGRGDAAIAAFERAQNLDADNPETLHAFGETLNRLCQPDRAIPILHRAFAIDRYVPPSWAMTLGHSANLQGRYEAAAERLEDVISRAPGFLPARVQHVRALSGLGRHDDLHRAVDEIRLKAPRYRIQNAARMFPYPDPAQSVALLGALRDGGLPE